MTDHEIILAIQEVMDGNPWDLSMLSEIAELLTSNGYALTDKRGDKISYE